MKKLPDDFEETYPPVGVARADLNNQSARIATLQTENIQRGARIRSNNTRPGNRDENMQRAILGQQLLPEVLSDNEQFAKNEAELAILVRGLPGKVGNLQREKDVASKTLCAMVADDHKALVKDVAANLSAFHASLTTYFDFLDKVEATGASTTALRPIYPNGLHPRDTYGTLHWTFKEMRENGHITMSDIPEAVR